MREKRRKYSPEFKSEAVRLIIETSRPIVEAPRRIGVHEGILGVCTGLSMSATNHR